MKIHAEEVDIILCGFTTDGLRESGVVCKSSMEASLAVFSRIKIVHINDEQKRPNTAPWALGYPTNGI